MKKSVVRIKLTPGALAGYTLNDKVADRRKVLARYAKQKGWGEVVKRLNVLYIYNKNKRPETASKFKRDMRFIQRTFDVNYSKKQRSQRKSSKRKSPKRKSSKRTSSKRKSSKRKSSKRTSSKRKSQRTSGVFSKLKSKRKSYKKVKGVSKHKSKTKAKNNKMKGGGVGFYNLPDDILLQQLISLDYKELLDVCRTNKRINTICKTNQTYLYKNIFERKVGRKIREEDYITAWLEALFLPTIKGELPDFKLLQILLTFIDINARDAAGVSVLMHTIQILSNRFIETTQPKIYTIIDIILKKGADVNLASNNGETPLMVLSRIMNDTLDGLMSRGKYSEEGASPLRTRYVKLFNKLLDEGADINARTKDGTSVLLIALDGSSSKNPQFVKFVLERGADVNIVDRQGISPLFHVLSWVIWKENALNLTHGAEFKERVKNAIIIVDMILDKMIIAGTDPLDRNITFEEAIIGKVPVEIVKKLFDKDIQPGDFFWSDNFKRDRQSYEKTYKIRLRDILQ